jgi:hypothetical protein
MGWNLPVLAYVVVVLIVVYYVLLKEKEASGCKKEMSIAKFCDDNKSDYVIDSVPSLDDTFPDVMRKLRESSRSYEKVAVWRKCLIISTLCVALICLFGFPLITKSSQWCVIVPMHIIIFFVVYMNYSHTNFHVSQRIRDNVDVLVDKATNMHQSVTKVASKSKREVKMNPPPPSTKVDTAEKVETKPDIVEAEKSAK